MHIPTIAQLSRCIHASGAEISVCSSSLPATSRERIERTNHAVSVGFGPMFMSLTPSQAIEMGDALITAAHQFRAQSIGHFDEADALPTGAAA